MRGGPMIKAAFRYLYEDVDRHGNVRLYVWRGKGYRKVRLRSQPGTAAFAASYEIALAESQNLPPPPKNDPLMQPVAGTYRWLCVQYMRSVEFRQLDPRTQRVRRCLLEKTYDETIAPATDRVYADVPITQLNPTAIRVLRDRKSHVPQGANNRLKALRQVFSWAIEAQVKGVTYNPARDVAYLKRQSDGFHSWSIEEIEQYEARHPIGTRARLALALLVYTGQRRSDVVCFGRQHVRKGWLHFTQVKNRNRKPVIMEIPILSVLQHIIDESPLGDLTFLVTERGAPFTANGFGNKMRQWCNEAKLPHCSAHGLRKASAAIAAENGATEDQLMAIFGWLTPKQAAHYTKGARRRKLAGDAMGLLDRRHRP